MDKKDEILKEANDLATSALLGDLAAEHKLKLLIKSHSFLSQLSQKLKNNAKKKRKLKPGKIGPGMVLISSSGKTSARTWKKTK
ncbi:hypothetical protein [Alishewanella sp. HL-SH06]|uniref:hypothetical protein n=1 Tax=Alishewanella sp. HL-SH06 TaxID=3461144 RepID=UPI00404245F1